MIPAHKQTDPNKAPGQVANNLPAPRHQRLRGTLGEVIGRIQRQEADADRINEAERRRMVGSAK